MTIIEFINGRNVDSQAVRRYIERHPDEFNGHTGKKGREITLDEVAIEILEKKYPLPQMVQVIEDTESIKKLNALQEKFIELQEQFNKQAVLIAQAEAQKILLEDKELQLQKAENELAKYKRSWFGLYKKVE